MKQIYIKHTLSFLFLAFSQSVFASSQYIYQYTPGCRKAYNHYLSLQITQGNTAIKQEFIVNPYNLMATYIADYEDCIILLLNGDKRDYLQRKSHQYDRLELLEKGNPSSPMHLFCQAGIYLHWAFVNVRFGEDWKAAMAFRKSFLLLKENRERFPQFEYNNVFFSMEEAVLGAIPDNYKWVASIFGMKGNIKHGISELEKFVSKHSSNDLLYNESVFYYCYLKFYLQSKYQEVWSFMNTEKYDSDNSLMNAFVKANIAVNYRKADEAIKILTNMRNEPEYIMFPVFDYEMACALQMKLDDNCLTYFQKFIKRYNGRLFVKDTWQRMALQYYMRNDMKQAFYCRNKIKEAGNIQVDADKQAQRFAEGSNWPNIILLQARLLIDGGFYKRALNSIEGRKEKDFSELTDRLEYNFRLGRIYDELGEYKVAAQYYKRTIFLGKGSKEYFAARAALQMGLMHERLDIRNEAISNYKLCLSMKGHDFQNSIDQQAKAGINRLTVQ